MSQPINQPQNKERYQFLLVGFFIAFIVFVKCYMLWVHPAAQKAYQKVEQKIETQEQVLWQYPSLVIPPINK